MMWPFKSKKKGRRHKPINEAQTFTQPIIIAHTITRPSNSTDTVTRPSSLTDNTHGTAFSDDARCSMARFISIFDYSEWTTDV
ncbi:hypothetical protein Goklo_029440 [Gossypium klotzschianum]|uniref:Uncharacterized protein n=1 Tax=Gossypium klotzschianum TaxID=34286 RepID=A0A7J8WAZ3_9ROSI|nr:hypothetical protein [Gossypium klotzschianum]